MHELFIQLLEAVAPERIWKSGHRSGAKCGEKKLLVMPLHFFLAIKVQLVVLVSAFVMVSTVWSVSFLVFFYSRCPRAQSFVKVGARAPRALWSRRHWSEDILYRYATATVCACLYVMYICVKVEDGNAGKCGSGDYGNPRCIFLCFHICGEIKKRSQRRVSSVGKLITKTKIRAMKLYWNQRVRVVVFSVPVVHFAQVEINWYDCERKGVHRNARSSAKGRVRICVGVWLTAELIADTVRMSFRDSRTSSVADSRGGGCEGGRPLLASDFFL